MKEEFKKELDKAQKCCVEIIKAVSAKKHPKVPRPSLEPTPLRDAACHMLWHTRELDLGREPLTTDKLAPQ